MICSLISYGSDSIDVRILTTSRNMKFKITRFNEFSTNVLLDTSFGSKNNKIFETRIPIDSIIFNNKLNVKFWIKRRLWFGWQRFSIIEDIDYEPTHKVLSIYKSEVHKRRYRYVFAWRSLSYLD